MKNWGLEGAIPGHPVGLKGTWSDKSEGRPLKQGLLWVTNWDRDLSRRIHSSCSSVCTQLFSPIEQHGPSEPLLCVMASLTVSPTLSVHARQCTTFSLWQFTGRWSYGGMLCSVKVMKPWVVGKQKRSTTMMDTSSGQISPSYSPSLLLSSKQEASLFAHHLLKMHTRFRRTYFVLAVVLAIVPCLLHILLIDV